eukprot:Sspe_Gene.37946::Locus_18309_Transcript_1_1_Confidence_1.000_Length_3201::g.37946::m.37946
MLSRFVPIPRRLFHSFAMDGWKKEEAFSHQGAEVSKWVSSRTAMRMVIARTPGPLVDLFLPLATESQGRDDGCPHTLEHLVFLGSEDYPHKGILDKVANRNLADGTNAWTSHDSTVYTLTTAGKHGALAMLPTYIDHLLFPTLTDSAFITEVHHITGEGSSSGVVYCEMQGRENTWRSRVERAQAEALFANHDYSNETGGLMACLRTLTNDTIRQYHKEYYRPDNLGVILVGDVTPEEVAKALQPMEEKILRKGIKPLPPSARPWSKPIPPLKETVVKRVEFPSDDEEHGLCVQLAWRGPVYTEWNLRTQIEVLLMYLSDTTLSPVRAELVDCEDAVAGQVFVHMETGKETYFEISLCDVKRVNVDVVEGKLLDTLARAVKNIDKELMLSTIRKSRAVYLRGFETNAAGRYTHAAVADFLYGSWEKPELQKELDEIPAFDEMADFPMEKWQDLLDEWFLKRPHTTVIAVPSKEMASRLQAEEEARNEETRKRLGEEGLKECAARVEEAQKLNDREIPPEIEESFKVPSVDSISFFPVSTYRSLEDCSSESEGCAELKKRVLKHTDSAPGFFLEMDEVNTNFVKVAAILNSEGVDKKLLPYLEIFMNMFYERPMTLPDGRSLSLDEVVKSLNSEVISKHIGQGVGQRQTFETAQFSKFTAISMEFFQEQYNQAVEWLRRFLYFAEFPVARVKICAQELLDRTSAVIGDARAMLIRLSRCMALDDSHPERVINPVYQEAFLKKVLADPEDAVRKLEQLARELAHPKNLRVQCVANFKKMPEDLDLMAPWNNFLPPAVSPSPPTPITPLTYSKEGSPRAVIVGLASTDSSFLARVVPGCPKYGSQEMCNLWIASDMYCMLEGPFWKGLRGAGLTYGYKMLENADENTVGLYFIKSTDVHKAFEKAGDIVSGKGTSFNTNDFVGARAARIYTIAQKEGTVSNAALQPILAHIRGLPLNYNHSLLMQVGKADEAGVADTVKYLKPIFETDSPGSLLAIVCAPNRVAGLLQDFEKYGLKKATFEELLS